MNNNILPTILLKADNCFFLTLDGERNIDTSNQHFTDIAGDETVAKGKSFLDLFSPAQQSRWLAAFDEIDNNTQNVKTIAASLKESKKPGQIEWNVCALVNDKGVLYGYELLGILCTDTTDQQEVKLLLNKQKKILDSSLDIICSVNENGKFREISAAGKSILGYEPEEMIGKNFTDFLHIDDFERTMQASAEIRAGSETKHFENRFCRKDGSVVCLNWSAKWEETDKIMYAVARDAAEQKAAEKAMRVSEEKYRILFYNHPLPMWIYDTDTFSFLEVNEAAVELLGYTSKELLGTSLKDILDKGEVEKFENLYQEEDYFLKKHRGLWTHKKKNNDTVLLEITSNAIEYGNKNAKLVLGIDRTEKIKAEQELIKSNERYLFLSQATFDAIWDWDLATGEVEWNEGVKNMFDIPDPSDISSKNWWYNNIHDDDRDRVINKLNDHITKHIAHWEDEYRFKNDKDNYIYVYDRAYTIFDKNNIAIRMIGAMQDLTERKMHENMLQKLNNSLEKRARELAESNTELERFAYVASHDLQEPLRMVTSFLQLLEKRYRDKLDQKAREYIDYAVDGAERMKRLILDLLEYSRVNSSKLEKEEVDLNDVIKNLKLTYKNILTESHGSITHEKLPVVRGNKTQLMQLFQNIVSNALKYKSQEPPVITIACIEDVKLFEFMISDNGIGIDPKFFNKIFIIFQRLHNRDQYSGTGIGLAICKKIIDKHGGKIWVNSQPAQGSTFHFTLPKAK